VSREYEPGSCGDSRPRLSAERSSAKVSLRARTDSFLSLLQQPLPAPSRKAAKECSPRRKSWVDESKESPPHRGKRTVLPELPVSEIPCQVREVPDFHNRETESSAGFTSTHINTAGENPRLKRGLQGLLCRFAPNPVTGLWTACTRLKRQVLTNAHFSLTGKIEGVEQDRSLTAS
jgi:hypothetical protein